MRTLSYLGLNKATVGDKRKFPVGEFSLSHSPARCWTVQQRRRVTLFERTNRSKRYTRIPNRRCISDKLPRACFRRRRRRHRHRCCCCRRRRRCCWLPTVLAPMREMAYMDQKEIANFLAKELFYQQVSGFCTTHKDPNTHRRATPLRIARDYFCLVTQSTPY